MGFTLQSFSPSQSRTPEGAVALLLFLTSRHPALRTRTSRCPAAPGPCSLRGSVPAEPKSPGPMLSWDSLACREAAPARPRAGRPATAPSRTRRRSEERERGARGPRWSRVRDAIRRTRPPPSRLPPGLPSISPDGRSALSVARPEVRRPAKPRRPDPKDRRAKPSEEGSRDHPVRFTRRPAPRRARR
jgi:hypothetical protein